MVLYLKDFEKAEAIYGKYLRYYDELPEYLHKMSAEEILEHINRNGVISSMYQKIAVKSYIKWLFDNHAEEAGEKELSELNFELHMLLSETSSKYIGFYDIDDLKQGIECKLQELENENPDNLHSTDFSGLKALFFLEWYGIPNEAALSIKLSDVSDDGKTVYVPSEDRTVNITDSMVAVYLSEYKQKTGHKKYTTKKELPYTQDTFYRNTSSRPINMKTIYNIKCNFQGSSIDKRFEKKRLYRSGRFYEMLCAEKEFGQEYISTDKKSQAVIDRIFNYKDQVQVQRYVCIIREYRLYKSEYISRI